MECKPDSKWVKLKKSVEKMNDETYHSLNFEAANAKQEVLYEILILMDKLERTENNV